MQDLIAVELAAGEAGIHLPSLGGLCRGAHTLNALFHAESPLIEVIVAHERPQSGALDGLLQLLNFGLFLQVLLHALLIAPLFFHSVEAIIARIELRLSVLDLNDTRDGAVEKIAVVADGDHRAAELAEVFLQPFRSLQVQVVGRLVQQEDVRILQNETA